MKIEYEEYGPYYEYGPAHEKALKLQSKGYIVREIRKHKDGKWYIHYVVRSNPMVFSIRIPERVLVWRERLHKGSIMKPRTFKRIGREATRRYHKKSAGPAAGGKAYWVTTLRKYLDVHPGDRYVESVLRKLVGRRYMGNPRRRMVTRRKGRMTKAALHRLALLRDVDKMMSRNPSGRKWYVGWAPNKGSKIFPSTVIPTKVRYPNFKKVIGPFDSKSQVESWLKSSYGWKSYL